MLNSQLYPVEIAYWIIIQVFMIEKVNNLINIDEFEGPTPVFLHFAQSYRSSRFSPNRSFVITPSGDPSDDRLKT